jgi:hypothetical protein
MRFVRRFERGWRPALVALVLAAYPAFPHAQTTSASVSGVVQDSQGSVLPGVTVSLTSQTQGQTLTTTTDGEGRFIFAIVRPDTYSLQASLEGFKTIERTKVVVNANDRLSTGTMVLEVGSLTEEITVTARVTELQTNSGERSFALESEALKNIANDGRSLFGFATLVPGVLPQAGNGGTNMGGPATQVSGFTVNGQRPNSNNMTIDGVSNIDTGDNGGNMVTTNIDAVEEFKILTNAYQAEYGRAVGGQVQVVTKSGTQQFHGSGYWYGRRSSWNAESWTNKRAGITTPDASRNDTGYTVGGPAYKRRLFFFWAQEFQRRQDPVGERRARVPTALERNGDFSQTVDNSGNPFPYIRDYATGLPCSASNTSGCFQDGGVLGRIPQNRLYQPGLAGLRMYPMPNTDRGSGLNYASQTPDNRPRREEMLRMDFQPTDTWRVTGRYMHNKDEFEQAYGTTWAGAGSDGLDNMQTIQLIPGSNFLASSQGVLNNSTSVEVSVGRAHNSLDFVVRNDALRREAAGLSGIPLLFPDAVQDSYIPDLNFRGGRVGGDAGRYNTDRGPFTNQNTTWDVLANLTKIWGAHAFKVGVYYQNSYKPQSIFSSFNSQISFIDDGNNPFDTGHGYSNAATGVFNTYTQASKYAVPEWRYKNFEWYGQDTWKRDRLTLDFGVRFYHMTPQWDTSLQASNFVPELFDRNNAARLYFPVCIGASPCSGDNRRGMDPRLISQGVAPSVGNTVAERFIGRLVPGSNRFNGAFQAGQGIDDKLQSGTTFSVSPRLGAAYDITGRAQTIVRGGWAIVYDRPQGNAVFDMGANAPGVLVSQLQYGRLQDLASAGGDPDATLSLNPTGYDFKPPKVYQWNIGVQHKLWYDLILDASYVGSESTDLMRRYQMNAVPLGAKFLPQNQDPTRAPSATPGATALPDDFLRPFPGYNNIQMWDYSSRANYHALQLGVNRRFDRGVMFSTFYVRSRALTLEHNNDFAPPGGSPGCQCGPPNFTPEQIEELDWSYAPYNRPHNFIVNFVYQVPSVASGGLGVLANDWQLSGIYRYSSGVPYQINYSIPGITATNLSGNNGAPGARIVVNGDPGPGSSDDPYRQIANVGVFAPPQPGSQGNESERFFLHGPSVNNLDLSFSKRVPLRGSTAFEIRFDLFNALDHVQWTGVNNTINFASLTDPTITNLPYNSSGQLVNQNGFGSITGVRPPRTLQLVTRFTF